MIRHISMSLKLTIVALYMLIACWFVPESIAKALEKGINEISTD